MKYSILVVSFFISSFLSFGQRIVSPLEYNPEQAAHYEKNSRLRLMAAGDTLDLPFFDDFTQSTISPDINKWEPNGGTYINNSYPFQPPNFNVASFDGIKENGTPYTTTNTTAVGLTDVLTSRPIDLSVLVPGDSVFLRFYWQGKGLGEKADAVDSLRLQLKTVGNIWNTVWKKTGDSTAFTNEVIRIGNAALYYYKGFQFRYQSYGRKSGAYDVWNVDYIYLDTGRLAKDNWAPDMSFSGPPSSFLKNYTAMPIQQYLADPVGERADSIRVQLVSLYNKGFLYQTDSSSILEDIKNNVIIDTLLPQLTNSLVPFERPILKWKPDITLITANPAEKILKYSFVIVDTLDPKFDELYNFTGPLDKVKSRINFNLNDTVSGYTYLTDYYAYDDGSAEYGYGVNQITAKVAVKYNLNVPDTLTHIDICFPRIGPDQSDEPITLTVWNYINKGGTQDSFLYRETVLVEHPTGLNNFHRYQLETPLFITRDSIYVGYQQSTNEVIFTGLDKNKNNNNKNFFSINGTWFLESEIAVPETGSLMIRPVFSNTITTKVNPKTTEELDCEVFPNPSNGTVNIAGMIRTMNLYDLSGRLLLSKEYDDRNQDIKTEDLSFLPNGFYIMHLENKDAKAVKKIIIAN